MNHLLFDFEEAKKEEIEEAEDEAKDETEGWQVAGNGRIKSSADPKPQLSKIEGVKSVKTEESEGLINVDIYVNNTEKFFKGFADSFKSNPWVIYELSQKHENLEEIFRELTRE